MSSIHDIVLVGGSTKILPLEYTSGYGYGHTGDPNMDRMEFALPEPVKKFLVYFQEMIKEADGPVLQGLALARGEGCVALRERRSHPPELVQGALFQAHTCHACGM